MLVYSVNYLNSLGAMFPNLTVIRGQRLFSNYALVIFKTDLLEVSKLKRADARFTSALPSDHVQEPSEDQPRLDENWREQRSAVSPASTKVFSFLTVKEIFFASRHHSRTAPERNWCLIKFSDPIDFLALKFRHFFLRLIGIASSWRGKLSSVRTRRIRAVSRWNSIGVAPARSPTGVGTMERASGSRRRFCRENTANGRATRFALGIV